MAPGRNPEIALDRSEPCIIAVAITGSRPRKEDNPAVPISVAEQIELTQEAFEAGASLVHIHVRNDDQSSSSDPARFAAVQEGVRRHCPGMIVQFSTGGRGRDPAARGSPLFLKPDMASLSTGSVNFPSIVYENHPRLVDDLAAKIQANGVLPEIEIFDLSHRPRRPPACRHGSHRRAPTYPVRHGRAKMHCPLKNDYSTFSSPRPRRCLLIAPGPRPGSVATSRSLWTGRWRAERMPCAPASRTTSESPRSGLREATLNWSRLRRPPWRSMAGVWRSPAKLAEGSAWHEYNGRRLLRAGNAKYNYQDAPPEIMERVRKIENGMPRARRADRGGGAPISAWALAAWQRSSREPSIRDSRCARTSKLSAAQYPVPCLLVRLEKRKAACRASARAVGLVMAIRCCLALCPLVVPLRRCSTRNHDPKQTLANGVVNDRFAPNSAEEARVASTPRSRLHQCCGGS